MQKSSLVRFAALTLFTANLAFALPAHAQDTDAAAPPAATDDQAQQPAPATAAAPGKMQGMDQHVEQRIKTLHDKLKITPDQEKDWKAVAQTMRENEAEMAELIKARHQNPQSMTAIDDLQSYQKITQAHADGIKNLISSFQTLYNDMSDAQKQNADQVFGAFEGHDAARKHKKHA